MLYDVNRHLTLPTNNWNKKEASAFVSNLFNTTEKSFLPQHYWKKNVNGESEGLIFDRHLYSGLAGIVWSQKTFEQQGYGIVKNDYVEALEVAKINQLAILEAELDFENKAEYLVGLLIAELGFLVAQYKLSANARHLSDIARLVKNNTSNAVGDYMWGTPGLIAAGMSFVNEKPELISAIKQSVSNLKQQLLISSALNTKIWQQNIYGHKVSHIGAFHGFAGNAFAIIRSFPLLENGEVEMWSSLIRETIKLSAIRYSQWVNWPQSIDGDRPGRNEMLVQFCHGAPGIVCCLSKLMDQGDTKFDELMLAAGELTWQAGPLAKGANLCHGTAGNGFAFLKIFEITRDEEWLSRAKSFATHAMLQAEQAKKNNDNYHFSLWTGDTGVGHFVDACLKGNADIPTMDYF